jgi:hypothetical protein
VIFYAWNLWEVMRMVLNKAMMMVETWRMLALLIVAVLGPKIINHTTCKAATYALYGRAHRINKGIYIEILSYIYLYI